MNERIVYTRPDGGVSVIIPSPKAGKTIDGKFVPMTIQEIMAKDVPSDAVNPRIVTVDDLPQDRLFRGAWDDSNPESFVGVNLTKAKQIAHDYRRSNRQTKLEPLDKEASYMSTTPARKGEIAAEKQTILDANAAIQVAIDAAVDETELRTVLSTSGVV